jgi:hypothetical protein
VFRKLAWATLIGLGLLLIVNALPYFSFGRNFSFLDEKGPLVDVPLWRLCFYGHLLGSILCFIVLPFLFWTRLRDRFPALHRWLGRAYGLAVLGWAAPTARGVQTAVARRFDEHRRWMIRSAAIAGSAIFFRVFHVAFYGLGVADEPNYILSLWLSFAASVVVGEALVRRSPDGAPSGSLKGALP